MPYATDAVLRIIDRQTVQGQEALNIYYFKSRSGNVDPIINTANSFWATFGDYIRSCQSGAVQHLAITIEDLGGTRDYAQYDIPSGSAFGLLGNGDTMAPYQATELKFSAGSRLVKPGSKRYAGVDEGDIGPGGYLTAPMLGHLNALGAAFLGGFDDALVVHLDMVIVGFPHPASTRYPARAAMVALPIQTYSVLPYTTTQNTRKYGRGS